MKHRIGALIIAALVSIALSVGIVTPANAATHNVTIEIGNWNCQSGGRRGYVSSVLIDVVPGTNPVAQWTGGNKVTRNIIFNTNGSAVRVAGKAHCKTWFLDPGYYVDIVGGRWVTSSTSTYWRV